MTDSDKLGGRTLLHSVYRSLLNTGRTYAAFRDDQLCDLVDALKHHTEILDPMSGYGSLMVFCSRSEYAVRTYNVECNPPSYFWQILVNPENCDRVEALANILLSERRKWPSVRCRVDASEGWFPGTSLILLEKVWLLCAYASGNMSNKAWEICLALLLPFVGRLSSFVQGNVVTHAKPGGICVYSDWHNDFATCLLAIKERVTEIRRRCSQRRHTVVLGDSRECRISRKRFSAMITSPPYPNGRNYSVMFAPENAFIDWLVDNHHITDVSLKTRLIGCPVVAENNGYRKRRPDDIKSIEARRFLAFLETYDKDKRAVEDNRVYYIPYYSNYFYDLERAFENIAQYLSPVFEGYVVIVNNTARKRVIPVAEAVVEMWHNLGFTADVVKAQELAHVGGINPRVKGLSARHMEYTIKIVR